MVNPAVLFRITQELDCGVTSDTGATDDRGGVSKPETSHCVQR